eukprot:827426_1
MTTKKDNKKDSTNKNKKRDKPDEKEWEWEDTELKDPNETPLLAQDIKQLLITRGEEKTKLKGKKSEMIEYLKEKYTVQLNEKFERLTCKELIVELRLRGLTDTPAKKDILIARLKGEREDEPPKKKQKRGKKAKSGAKVYVAVYTPSVEVDDTSTKVLGVFKSESKAYDKSIDKLSDDIEKKYGDKTKKIEKAFEQIDKIDSQDYKKRFEAVGDALTKAFGNKEDDAPYCDIIQSNMTT